MKKTILSALIFAPLFAGCVSTADTSGDLDRNAVVAELSTRMDTLGYQHPVDIVPGINEFLNASAMVLERQYKNEVAMALALSAGSSMMGMFAGEEDEAENPKDIGVALLKAKDQLSLALEANEIIELEQATISSINELQLELEAKG